MIKKCFTTYTDHTNTCSTLTSSWQAFALKLKLCGLRVFVISAPEGLRISSSSYLLFDVAYHLWAKCVYMLISIPYRISLLKAILWPWAVGRRQPSRRGSGVGAPPTVYKESHSGVLWCTRRTLRNHSGVRRYGRSKGTHLHCLRSYHRSYPATRHTSELHQPCVFVSLLGLVFWVYDILLLVALDWFLRAYFLYYRSKHVLCSPIRE